MIEVCNEIFYGPQNVGLDFRNYFSRRKWVRVGFLGITLLFHKETKENMIKIKKVENLINTYFFIIFQILAPKM